MNDNLTPKQSEVYDYVKAAMREKGYCCLFYTSGKRSNSPCGSGGRIAAGGNCDRLKIMEKKRLFFVVEFSKGSLFLLGRTS